MKSALRTIALPVSAISFAIVAIALAYNAVKIGDLGASLQETESQLREKRIDLDRETANLRQIEAELAKSQTELTKSQADFAANQAELAKSQTVLAKSQADLAANQAELAKASTQRSKLNDELADITKGVIDLKADLVKRSRELHLLNNPEENLASLASQFASRSPTGNPDMPYQYVFGIEFPKEVSKLVKTVEFYKKHTSLKRPINDIIDKPPYQTGYTGFGEFKEIEITVVSINNHESKSSLYLSDIISTSTKK